MVFFFLISSEGKQKKTELCVVPTCRLVIYSVNQYRSLYQIQINNFLNIEYNVAYHQHGKQVLTIEKSS
jgi:hypothetical protein